MASEPLDASPAQLEARQAAGVRPSRPSERGAWSSTMSTECGLVTFFSFAQGRAGRPGCCHTATRWGQLPWPRPQETAAPPWTRRLTSFSSLSPSLAKIELVCFFQPPASDNRHRRGDRGVVLALRHLGQDLRLPCGERGPGLDACGCDRDRTSSSTTIGSMTEPPLATARHGADQIVHAGHPLLEQVRPGPPSRASSQRYGIAGCGVTG